MTAHTDSDAMVAFNDQEAVDRAFDDYVDREWVARRAPDESRARCRGCGGGNYCFGTSASGDIGAKICTDCLHLMRTSPHEQQPLQFAASGGEAKFSPVSKA